MADKLMIVMVNTDPRNGSELGAPFFQATVAAAMEYEVEVIMTGRSGELAIKGVAENLKAEADSPKTVYDIMRDAHEAGVKFKICTPTLGLWGKDLIQVRTRVSEHSGARVQFAYELHREGTEGPLAVALTAHAAVDGRGRPRRLPEALRSLLG